MTRTEWPTADDHDAWPLAVRDPYIGPCWTVDCPFCGVMGRYDTHAQAERAAKVHRERERYGGRTTRPRRTALGPSRPRDDETEMLARERRQLVDSWR